MQCLSILFSCFCKIIFPTLIFHPFQEAAAESQEQGGEKVQGQILRGGLLRPTEKAVIRQVQLKYSVRQKTSVVTVIKVVIYHA